jgi:membrane associated rhomboid family serine protease
MIVLPTEKRFDWSNPPFALLLIILLNVVIFFIFQFGDNEKLGTAIGLYQQEGLFEVEWPEYQDYLTDRNEIQRLVKYQEFYKDGNSASIAFDMLYDQQFYQHLKQNSAATLAPEYLERWLAVRQAITDIIVTTSFHRFGLIPSRLDPVNMIAHQFLHGGIMHLLGNMFFLVVCGFAVEAAIGHVPFLLFYLLSGVAGGLVHSFGDLQSITPLVGASGSISGVMAMYLAVFRMRKIEFFYWFYIFVGYFRAPALIILPLYIGKEVFDYFSPGESNIGYLAHAGGFLLGALQIGILVLFKRDVLNEKYIEEDQSIDPRQQQLDVIYQALAKFHFPRALSRLDEHLEKDPGNFELQRLKHQLLQLLDDKNLDNHALHVLAMRNLSEKEINQQQRIFQEHPNLYGHIEDDQLARLGISFCRLDDVSVAESIFILLHDKGSENDMLGVFARKLSLYFQNKRNQKKADHYDALAETYLARNT